MDRGTRSPRKPHHNGRDNAEGAGNEAMPANPTAMFITVRYGDGRHHIFNPDCRNNVLVHAIKKRCDCDFEELVDLSDEQGAVKNIHSNPGDYATNYLADRETLILLRVDREDEDERPHYVPLLQGLEEEFVAKLNPRPKGTSRRGSVHDKGHHGGRGAGHGAGRRTSVSTLAKANKAMRKVQKLASAGKGGK